MGAEEVTGVTFIKEGAGCPAGSSAAIAGQRGTELHSRPPKRPLSEREGLRFGIDIDGTIAQAPRHFKRLIDALLTNGNQVYIVTGRRELTRAETESLLHSLGISFTELVMRPDDWAESVAEFKVRVVREKDLHLVIDDDVEVCLAISEHSEALAAHMLPFAEAPESV